MPDIVDGLCAIGPANGSEHIFVTLVGEPHAEIMEQEADRAIASGSGGPYDARALDPW